MDFPETPQKLSNTTNELAKQRNRYAAARTLANWIQNSLTLMGLGIALEQISIILRKAFPHLNLSVSRQISHTISLSLIAFALILLVIAIWQYRLEIQLIKQDDYLFLSSRSLIRVTITAVVLFGMITAIIIFVKTF